MKRAHSPDPQDDLTELIKQADEQLLPPRNHTRRAKRRYVPTIRLSVLLTLLIILCVVFFRPLPERIVQADLIDLLKLASEEVDEFLQRQGQLPAVLPSPALSAIVRYLPGQDAPDYRLIACNGAVCYEYSSDHPDTFAKVQ